MLRTYDRAALITRLHPVPCSCGAGDHSIRHEANCAAILAFEDALRQAERELKPQPCKLGNVVRYR